MVHGWIIGCVVDVVALVGEVDRTDVRSLQIFGIYIGRGGMLGCIAWLTGRIYS